MQEALNDPASVREYVRSHAQELDDDVIDRHIKTYVNECSLGLGETGRAAVAQLEQMAKAAGIISNASNNR